MNTTNPACILAHLQQVAGQTVDLICASPCFDTLWQDEDQPDTYISRFMPFMEEFARLLSPGGSLVLEVRGGWLKDCPVRNPFPYQFLLHMCTPPEQGGPGWSLAQELYWYAPYAFPMSRALYLDQGMRLKTTVAPVWWLSRSLYPKADNRRVLRPYSKAQKQLMNKGDAVHRRPSGHHLSGKFGRENQGAIPPNIIADPGEIIGGPVLVPTTMRDAEAYEWSPHFLQLVIALCTEEGDSVLDPFASSRLPMLITKAMGRQWISIETTEGKS